MGYAHDIGSQAVAVHGFHLPLTSHAAGVTTASTEAVGNIIDRLAMGGSFQSVKSVVAVHFVGATTQKAACTVTLALEDADSSESTSFATYTTATSKVIGSTSEAAAANYNEVLSQDIDLAGAGRYLRQVVTVINTATCSSDTSEIQGTLFFGGAAIMPATT